MGKSRTTRCRVSPLWRIHLHQVLCSAANPGDAAGRYAAPSRRALSNQLNKARRSAAGLLRAAARQQESVAVGDTAHYPNVALKPETEGHFDPWFPDFS